MANRSNTAKLQITISELQRVIIAEALHEYNLKLKGQPDTRCIADTANDLEAVFCEYDQPLVGNVMNDLS